MNDRELLEMAAKAAGIELLWPLYMPGATEVPMLTKSMKDTVVTWWSPLADDGDALRLAVKLGIEIVPMHNCQVDAVLYMDGTEIVHVAESMREDKFSATRRAIVRAAAEIGKAMP